MVVAGAGAFLSFQAKGQVEEKKTELSRAVRSFETVAQQAPSPTQSNLEAAQANLKKLQSQFTDFVASLEETNRERAVFEGQPRSSQDMYFQLQTFAQNYREKARATEILIADDENFGFDEYVRPNSPSPAEQDIPRLHRQKVIMEYIVNRLFNSVEISDEEGESGTLRIGAIDQPYPASYLLKINGIQREPTRPQAAEDTTTRGRRPNTPAATSGQLLTDDTFTIDPQISARVENAISTDAFRVQFEGRTDALRNFLNGIASFEMPIVIRSVEVVPVSGTGNNQAARQRSTANDLDALFGAPAAPSTDTPQQIDNIEIVSDNVSRFTVTLEYIDVVKQNETTDSSETANN